MREDEVPADVHALVIYDRKEDSILIYHRTINESFVLWPVLCSHDDIPDMCQKAGYIESCILEHGLVIKKLELMGSRGEI